MASFAVRKSLSRAPRPLIWVILRQATLATQEGPKPYTIATMMMINRGFFHAHSFDRSGSIVSKVWPFTGTDTFQIN